MMAPCNALFVHGSVTNIICHYALSSFGVLHNNIIRGQTLFSTPAWKSTRCLDSHDADTNMTPTFCWLKSKTAAPKQR